MGWTDAPEIGGGAAWENAPVKEDIVMTTPDGGRVVRSQTGELSFVSPAYSTSDPATIQKIMEGAKAAGVSRAGFQEEIVQQAPVAARLTKLVEGTPFIGSYLDEIIGAFAGPEATSGVRALSSAMQETRPGQSLGLNLGGAALGTAATLAATPARVTAALLPSTGTRTIPAMLQGAGLGGLLGSIEGGIYGAGIGDEGTRAQEATSGAAMGGLLGGALGMAGPLISKGAENVIGRFRRSDVAKIAKDLNISKEAATVVKNTFDQGGDIAAARAAVIRAGDEGMLADAGYAAQALLDASAASGGRAGQIARTAVEDRMTRTGSALDATLDATLGPAPLGPKSAVAEIAEKSKDARGAAYGAAYGTPINYASPQGMKIEEVLGRVSPDDLIAGITEANKEMRSRGQINQQIMAVLGADGNVEFLREMPNVQQLDEVKKALQKLAYDNTDDFGRLTNTGQRYARLSGELRDAVSDAVPDYGTAVALGGDKLAEERAFTLGRDLLSAKTEIEDVMLELGKKPSEAQIEAAKSGLRSHIAKTLGDVRMVPSDPNIDARQVIKAVTDMSSENARTKIKTLMGAEADALLRQIDAAAQSSIVRTALSTNSKTAIRGSIKETVSELTTPGVLGQAMAGEPVNTSKALIQAVTGQTAEYTAKQRQRIFEDIARALTEKRGKTALAALDYLEQAMQGQPLTAAQNEFLARQIAATGMITGIPAAQEVTGR
jgi:hypothetical protein